MGLGIVAVQNTLELWQQGHFSNVKAVCEIGAQEIHVPLNIFESSLEQAGIVETSQKDFPGLSNWPDYPRCSAKYLYKKLGVLEYQCVDVNGDHGAINHDLNYELTTTELFGKFDLVTDHGACEHVFNVAEAYRTLHKLCKPGGLIVIAQSLWAGNGYFLYDRSFVDGIAAANSYEVLFEAYVVTVLKNEGGGMQDQFFVPFSRNLLGCIDLNKVKELGIYVVFRKINDEEFRIPYQGSLMSRIGYQYGFNRAYLKDPIRYSYLPESTPSRPEKIPGRVLVGELFRRALKKIGIKR